MSDQNGVSEQLNCEWNNQVRSTWSAVADILDFWNWKSKTKEYCVCTFKLFAVS